MPASQFTVWFTRLDRSFISWVRKNPANFPANFLQKIEKNFPTSFCSRAGGTFLALRQLFFSCSSTCPIFPGILFNMHWQLSYIVRDAPSTAGNSMVGSERPSPEPLLKEEASQPYWGRGENSGNALETLNALIYRAWGIPAVLSTGILGNALRAVSGVFLEFFRNFFRKSQPYWGYGPYWELYFCSCSSGAA